MVQVEEDAEAEAKIEKKTFKAAPKDEIKQNKKVLELTEELKGMSLEEIAEKSAKFQEIQEARDLEDILYS